MSEDVVKVLLEEIHELRELAENGGLTARRWLNLSEAAKFCGFSDPEKPDPKCRAFLKFLQSEEIRYKPGNPRGKFDMLFDVLELNEIMKRDRRPVAA